MGNLELDGLDETLKVFWDMQTGATHNVVGAADNP